MRFGHMSELDMVELMKRDLRDGCTVGKMKFCEHCVFGKHKRVKFNASAHITKGTLDYVHADLWGPSRKPSYGGARYMLTIIDDYSIKVWPYFLKNKDDTFATFKKWKVMIERQTKKKVKFFVLTMAVNSVRMLLMITVGKKALLGTTPSHTLLSRMVWLSA